MLKIDRRELLAVLAAGILAAFPVSALAQSVNVDDLHAPGQLGEMALGSPDAPVTVIEYGSFTCPHCGYFHNAIFSDFKAKYVDTGKVRFVFRSFLRNGPDVAISAIARCAPADEYFDVVDAYFSHQDTWLEAPDLRKSIYEEATAFDFTEASFDACLANQPLLEAFDAEMQRASSFGVSSTPTFFINGEKHAGVLDMPKWDELLGPLLAAAD